MNMHSFTFDYALENILNFPFDYALENLFNFPFDYALENFLNFLLDHAPNGLPFDSLLLKGKLSIRSYSFKF